MKRILTILTAALLVLAMLTACGAKEVDLNKVMEDLNNTYGTNTLTAVPDVKTLGRYYSIPTENVKQFAAEYTKDATNGYTEIILVEAVDAKDVATIYAALEKHQNDQLRDAKSYHPQYISMIEASTPKQKGTYVWLVISDQQDQINADIEKALK